MATYIATGRHVSLSALLICLCTHTTEVILDEIVLNLTTRVLGAGTARESRKSWSASVCFLPLFSCRRLLVRIPDSELAAGQHNSGTTLSDTECVACLQELAHQTR